MRKLYLFSVTATIHSGFASEDDVRWDGVFIGPPNVTEVVAAIHLDATAAMKKKYQPPRKQAAEKVESKRFENFAGLVAQYGLPEETGTLKCDYLGVPVGQVIVRQEGPVFLPESNIGLCK